MFRYLNGKLCISRCLDLKLTEGSAKQKSTEIKCSGCLQNERTYLKQLNS